MVMHVAMPMVVHGGAAAGIGLRRNRFGAVSRRLCVRRRLFHLARRGLGRSRRLLCRLASRLSARRGLIGLLRR
jgi:hypothetical protein